MGKDYKFISIKNKAKKDEYINNVTNIINKYYEKKGISKRYDAEDLIKQSEDPKRVQNFIKSNDLMQKIENQRAYGSKLLKENNIKMPDAFKRIYSYNLTVPKDDDINKDEIEKQNIEFIKSLADPNKIKENINKMMHETFEGDKTMFYETDIDKAIEIVDKNNFYLQKCHVLTTILANQGVDVSTEFIDCFDYYKTTLQDGGKVFDLVDFYSKELSLFMPEDLPFEDLVEINNQVKSETEKYKDILESGTTSFTKYFNHKGEEVYSISPKQQEYIKSFLEKNDKNHDFFLNKNIGGKDFKDELIKCCDSNVLPKIGGSINNASKNIDSPIINKSIKDLFNKFRNKDKEISTMENGKFIFKSKDLNENLNTTQKNNLIFDYLNALTNPKNIECAKYAQEIKKVIESCKINEKQVDAYKKIYDQKIPFDYVDSIDNDGIHFISQAPKEMVNNYQFDELKFSSINELQEKFKKSHEKNDITKNTFDFLSIAKETNERYKKRGLLSKIFSPSAWKERSILKEAKNIISNNDMSEKTFEDYLNNNDDFNKTYDSFKTEISKEKNEQDKAVDQEKVADIIERVEFQNEFGEYEVVNENVNVSDINITKETYINPDEMHV